MAEYSREQRNQLSRAVGNSVAQKKSNEKQGFGFVDNRTESIAQRKVQKISNCNTSMRRCVERNVFLQNKNMHQCAQLQIMMHGHVYNQLNGSGGFAEAFALHFKIKPWEIPSLIWKYLVHADAHNLAFNSYKQLLDQVLVGDNNFLPLTPVYVDANSRNTINTTGNRQNDRAAADLAYNNVAGWVWHHIEGVNFQNPNWRCDMILVEPHHHAQNHIGAVHQWEAITGRNYT